MLVFTEIIPTCLLKNNFLKIKIEWRQEKQGRNRRKDLCAYAGVDQFYIEQNPVRGYQSSVDHVSIHLGLGQHKKN